MKNESNLTEFKKLIINNAYVDNSLLIKKIIVSKRRLMIMSKPKGYEKTIDLEMLEALFNIEESNRVIFENLLIGNEKKIMEDYCNKFPTIYIDFDKLKGLEFNNFEREFRLMASCLYQDFSYVSNCLDINNLAFFNGVIESNLEWVSYKYVIRKLACFLHFYYKRRVIVLIDNYEFDFVDQRLTSFFKRIICKRIKI